MIHHTVFARLKDALQDLNKAVDPREVTSKLFLASTQIYGTEAERINNIYPYICSLLGTENVAVTIGRKKAESDALVKQVLDEKSLGETVLVL